MKVVTFLLLLSSTLWAMDLNRIRSSVFKLSSKSPHTAREFRGTGILFTKDSKQYILTSDHVVLHTNDVGTYHTAFNSVSNITLHLQFLGAEWGLGLALLEVKNQNPALKPVTYKELSKLSEAKSGDKGLFFGYAFDSNDLSEETDGKILDPKVPLPYFVHAPELLEIESPIGEFGMSGGGAFNHEGDLLGILAYQKILTEGRADSLQNRVYSIPQRVVLNWLEHYFQVQKDFKPVFSEPWWGQIQPEQVFWTNDGYFFGFRLFKNEVRMMGGRMEALLILKDGPSIRYDDTRGILKEFRKDLDKNVMAPAEFSLIDRDQLEPVLIPVSYPAFAITSLNQKGISLFAARGETHELRYARFKPQVDALEKEITALKTKMSPASEAVWLELSKDFDLYLDRLKAIPAKPTDPGPAGAAEFFSSQWLANTILKQESFSRKSGWAVMLKTAPEETKQLIDTFEKLKKALNILEVPGTV